MPDAVLLTELVLRGVAIGALLATAVGFFHSATSRSQRVVGAIFCLSVVGYVLNSSPALRSALGIYGAPATFISLGGTGYFWLFIVTLFGDRNLSLRLFVPAAILTALGLVGLVTAPPLRNGVWIFHNMIEIALTAHALYVIYASWRGDLVEARRRLRAPFLGLVAFYVIALSSVEIGESVGIYASWYSLASATALAVFCVAGCFMFLEAREAIFGAAAPPQTEPIAARLDPADRITLEKLAEEMDKRAAWKDDSLTIGSLAARLGVPEHRLRRLINDNLGHRNFAAFVNARRIEAAKRTLADPAQARTTVAAVAFDLSFGSLGPFNRAFKEATGKTPTQWRRDTLGNGSPNLEIPG